MEAIASTPFGAMAKLLASPTRHHRMIGTKKRKQPSETEIRELIRQIERFKDDAPGASARVAAVAGRIADSLKLSDEERKALHLSALLHGLGELVMNRDYAKSEQGLKPIQIADLQRHPVIAEQELHRLGFDKITQLTVRWHRENWDGSGYPDALRQEEIPLVCRILRVAEAFVSGAGANLESASDIIGQLERSAGIDFDPEVIRQLMEIDFSAAVDRQMRSVGE